MRGTYNWGGGVHITGAGGGGGLVHITDTYIAHVQITSVVSENSKL